MFKAQCGHNDGHMDKLHEFRAAALESGFVQVEECEGGTILWLRKQTPDIATNTHQRICIDSQANLLTVYWMTILGKIDSKSFRTVPSLQAWFASRPPSTAGPAGPSAQTHGDSPSKS
jgi:hypothetical protein